MRPHRSRLSLLALVALLALVPVTSAEDLVTPTRAARIELTVPATAAAGVPASVDVWLTGATGSIGGFQVQARVDGDIAELEGANTAVGNLRGLDLSLADTGGPATLAGLAAAPISDGVLHLGRLTVVPRHDGLVEVRTGRAVVADGDGKIIPVDGDASVHVRVGGADTVFSAPAVRTPAPASDAVPARTPSLHAEVLVDWQDQALADNAVCASSPFDRDGNGCLDVADLVVATPTSARSGHGGGGGVPTTTTSTTSTTVPPTTTTTTSTTSTTVPPTTTTTTSTTSTTVPPTTTTSTSTTTTTVPPTTTTTTSTTTTTVPSTPGTYVVTDTTDHTDATIGDGVCRTAVGTCSFRAAVQEARRDARPSRIEFNIPGNGPHRIQITGDLPRFTESATVIDGTTQPGSSVNTATTGTNATIGVEISGGFDKNRDGIVMVTGDNEIRGVSIFGFRRPVWIYGPDADRNRIVGSFIGTDAAGAATWTQPELTAHGIHIEQGASDTVIGTPNPADRMLVSGNGRHGIGVWHAGSDRTIVQNTLLGVTRDGLAALANQRHGIDLNFGSSDALIGGLGAGERNVISGNVSSGVEVSHTSATTGNQVVGNKVGTDASGYRAIPNGEIGIFLEDGVRHNLVAHNQVSFNTTGGIGIINGGTNGVTQFNTIRDNLVGVAPDLVTVQRNSRHGILVNGSRNIIGPGNRVAGSALAGIAVTEVDAVENTLTGNVLYANGTLAIDLAPIGSVNPNDGDPAQSPPGPGYPEGANGKRDHPVFSRTDTARLEGTTCGACTVELFLADGAPGNNGQAPVFRGSLLADGNGVWGIDTASTEFTEGEVVTATATDTFGNTSELSMNKVIERFDAPPTLSVEDVTVAEGDTIDLIALTDDPEGEPVTVSWDFDDDNIAEATGSTVPFDTSAVRGGLDGPTANEVTVTATDAAANAVTTTMIVTVTNAAPTGTFSVDSPVDEGGVSTLRFVGASDPAAADAADLRYAFDCGGADLAGVTWADAGAASSITCPIDEGPSSHQVSAVVLDDDGGRLDAGSDITGTNVAPTPIIDPTPEFRYEGTNVVAFGSASDPSVADTNAGLGLAWTAALDGEIIGTAGDADRLKVKPTDSGVVTFTLTATDRDGGSATVERTIEVVNAKPNGTFNATATDNQVFLEFTELSDLSQDDLDAGLRFAFTCDGSWINVAYADASTDPTFLCEYDDGLSDHEVHGIVIDKDDGARHFSTTATISGNKPPQVEIANEFELAENATGTVTATATDPEEGPLTYAWDLDNNGVFETPGQTVPVGPIDDGPTSRIIGLRVTDAANLSTKVTSTLQVTNVAPTATLDDAITEEGTPVTLSIGNVFDPSAADTATLRYAIGCAVPNLGAVTWSTASSAPTAECTFDDGPASVRVDARVFDDDGGSTTFAATVTVTNVAPTLVVSGLPATAAEGAQLSFSAAVDDVSAADRAGLVTTWSATLDGVPFASGNGTSGTFVPPDDGAVEVTVTTDDRDGGVVTVTTPITVTGVAPTATLVPIGNRAEGTTVTVTVSGANDVGPVDRAALRFAISCGGSLDGVTYASASATPSKSCTFDDDAVVTVVARVIDPDDLFSELRETITITNVAPTGTLVTPTDTGLGVLVPFDIRRVSDPSPTDLASLTYVVDCGDGTGPRPPSPDPVGTCTAVSSSFQTVTATVRDDDGGATVLTSGFLVHPRLVSNPGFENLDPAGVPVDWAWDPALSVTTTNVRDGANAVQQTTAAPTSTMLTTVLGVDERDSYLFEAFVDAPVGGTRTVDFRVAWFDANGSLIRTPTVGVRTESTVGYVSLNRAIDAPFGAVTARLQVAVTTQGSTVRIDDVSVLRLNQLANASFEADLDNNGRPDGWSSLSRFKTTSAVVRDGSRSAALVGDGSTFVPGQKIDGIVPGTDYAASVFVNLPPAANGAIVRLQIRWRDVNDATIVTQLYDKVTAPTAGWTQLRGSQTAPPGTDNALVEIKVIDLSTTAWIDDVLFVAD